MVCCYLSHICVSTVSFHFVFIDLLNPFSQNSSEQLSVRQLSQCEYALSYPFGKH